METAARVGEVEPDFSAIARAMERIASIDFSMIEFKLQHPDEGPPMSDADLITGRRDYSEFLALTMVHPSETFVPSLLGDRYWHAHILDTHAYMRDCEYLFGFYLHHFPYFGMRGAEDAARLTAQSHLTTKLRSAYFGSVVVGAANCGGGSCSSCGSL